MLVLQRTMKRTKDLGYYTHNIKASICLTFGIAGIFSGILATVVDIRKVDAGSGYNAK
jgi:hypothetical protein